MRGRRVEEMFGPENWNSISLEMANMALRVARVVHDARSDLATWITSDAVPAQGEWMGEHPTLEEIAAGLPVVEDLPIVFCCKGRYSFLESLGELYSCRVSESVAGGPVETVIETGFGWSTLAGMIDSSGFSELRGNAEKLDRRWQEAWESIGLRAPMGPVLGPGEGDALRWYSRGLGHLAGPVQLSLLLDYLQGTREAGGLDKLCRV
jgi:hypothetical protein